MAPSLLLILLGIGVVIGDWRGSFVAAAASRTYSSSAKMEDASAIEGLKLAKSLGLQDIIIENDCQKLVHACGRNPDLGV